MSHATIPTRDAGNAAQENEQELLGFHPAERARQIEFGKRIRQFGRRPKRPIRCTRSTTARQIDGSSAQQSKGKDSAVTALSENTI